MACIRWHHPLWSSHDPLRIRYTPSQRGNYHHSMFRNPTAAVNLFHVGKQYLTFCKAEAAVTHNLIGRKITSNVKHSDARNSLPVLDVIRSSHKRHSGSKYCKWTLRQTTGVCYTRIYVLGAPSHFPTEYRHEAAVVSREHRMKWVVVLGDSYQWPLSWECKDKVTWWNPRNDMSHNKSANINKTKKVPMGIGVISETGCNMSRRKKNHGEYKAYCMWSHRLKRNLHETVCRQMQCL